MIPAFFRLTLVLSLTLLFSPVSSGQEKHCLWKIESPNNTVYLLGSIHLMKSDHYPLPEPLESAFGQSAHIVTEVDVDSLGMREVMQGITAQGMYRDGRTLRESLTPETYGMILKTADRLGLNPLLLNPFRPWLTAITLVTFHLQTLGFGAEYGIDRYFHQKAGQEGKKRSALETVAYQTGLFAAMSDSMQEELLRQTLEEMEDIEGMFDRMYMAWKTGDAETMNTLLSDNYREYPGLYERIFLERNRNWATQVEGFLKEKENYLVIVGAGHLVGENSLIDLLRKRGYTVNQL